MAVVTITPDAPGAAPLPGYLATPAGEGPWPGLLVLHEAWGLVDQTRAAADRLASMGFLALAPDLYRGHPLRCIRAVLVALLRGRGGAFADLEAARAHLVASPGCTGRVGVIGFCLGGGFALLLAPTGRFAAASVNYGILPRDLSVLRGSCPIVASYGGRDGQLRGAAGRLERVLTELGVTHDVVEYPEAGHAFLNEGSDGPRLVQVLAPYLGIGPEPESAAQAWPRIGAFLHRHLAEPALEPSVDA